jgi:hypothetical protein
MAESTYPSWSAALLRRDLNARAYEFARVQNLLHDVSPGSSPVVIFGRDEHGRHGNFHPASDLCISANPDWLRRLTKVHTASRRSRVRKDWRWMELDSANSSDALLMNIFCHPEVFNGLTLAPKVASLLNIEAVSHPDFGVTPGVPLLKGGVDRTEIDLQLGDLFLEAKLTEGNFQVANVGLIERYRDFEAVFDVERIPRKGEGAILGYQLIRSVLAAFNSGATFCVLCDARRHDLIETWYSVLTAVHHPGFVWRLKLLTWQELALALPSHLRAFWRPSMEFLLNPRGHHAATGELQANGFRR